MALNGIVYMLLPVLAFLWLRHFRAARVYPAVTGAVICFVTTRLSDLLAHLVGFSADYGTKAAIASEIVCVFEETVTEIMRETSAYLHNVLNPYLDRLGNCGLISLPGDHLIYETEPDACGEIIRAFISGLN